MADWTSWYAFVTSTVRRATQDAGVYEVALDGQRWRYTFGWSSTVYYGMTRSGLRARLGDHLAGRGNDTIRELVSAQVPLKVRWWSTIRDPRAVECTLLEGFERRFGERPYGNVQGCAI